MFCCGERIVNLSRDILILILSGVKNFRTTAVQPRKDCLMEATLLTKNGKFTTF